MSRSSYVVSIENRSVARREQSYVIFSHPPQVTGPVQGRVWPIVISKTIVPASQLGTFKIMSRYYQAICGLTERVPAHGSEAVANDLRAVSLGDKRMDGSKAPGTSLSLSVSELKRPEFPRKAATPNANVGAFEIITGNDFTAQDAKDGNYIVGYGVYPKATPRASPSACFVPEPNAKYQVKPSHVYYIACGTFEVGSIIDPEKVTSVCQIDFSTLKDGKMTVSVVHDDQSGLKLR